MNKKLWILCAVIAVAVLAAACGSVTYGSNNATFPERPRGEIGAFRVVAPADGATVNSAQPVFTWTAADNAERYRLEIAEDEGFTAVVFRKAGLTGTSYAMTSTLDWRTDYWWRLTAQNADSERVSDVGAFRCRLSGAAAETPIPLDGPFTVNADGFAVTAAAADDDPLGTGRPTLRLGWQDNSIGWCVLSETVEVVMDAADAIAVTFLHTTDLGSITLRFLEQDSDLWVAQIPSRAGKNRVQTAVVPYAAFTLREDESFGDGEINFEYVQRVDISLVTFDAGELCLGDVKTVCVDDYPEPRVEEIDLGSADAYALNADGYALGVEIDQGDPFGNGKDTLVLTYPAGIAPVGWGVATRSLGVDLAEGDALMLRFKRMGTDGIFRVRLTEGDGDVWQATLQAPADLATRQILPFAEMERRADISTGDGQVQMDRLQAVDFCVEGMYGAGTAMFGELRIVNAADYEEEETVFGFRSVYGDHMVLQRDAVNLVRGYGAAGTTLTLAFDGATYPAAVGADGEWQVELPARSAGGSYGITLTDGSASRSLADVTFGDVYLFAGQSNMLFRLGEASDAAADTANADLRLFFQAEQAADAPADRALNGNWQRSDARNAAGYSAIAWMTGSALQTAQNVPVGIVTAAVGSTDIEHWMSADGFAGDKAGKNRYYNGMIAPLAGLRFTAAVWYQGENNCGWPASYVTLLGDLMADWRARLGAPELPFFVVQLPVYGHEYNWAYLREAQTKAVAADAHAYLIPTMDGGDPADIHPTRKQYIAARVAASIRRHVFGDDQIAGDAPVYRDYTVAGDTMTLSFEHAEGLRLVGAAVGFELAGADGRFRAATATIEGETVLLRAEGIDAPVYARYAYTSTPTACLFNGAGWPVGSFSTYFGSMYGVTRDLGAGAWSAENGSGNDPAFTIDSDGAAVTIAYNNALGAGWGNVNLAFAQPLNGGDTLFFRASVTGTPVSFSLRLQETDGDQWTAPFTIGEDGTVWLPLDDFTWSSGWGDKQLDLDNLIKTLTVTFGACYEEGVLSLSDLRVLNAADKPVPEPLVQIAEDFENGVAAWTTTDPAYGGTAQIVTETAPAHVARGAASARLSCPAGVGDAIYARGLADLAPAADRLFFRMKGEGKGVVFVYLLSGTTSYHLQIDQPAAAWTDYTFLLSEFHAGLKAEDLTEIRFAAQDWTTSGVVEYLYLDDVMFLNEEGIAEIPAANPPPAPVRTVIADFENGVAGWTASQVQDFASIAVSDVHNGGAQGARLRYAAGATDASFAAAATPGMQGDTLGFWLKGTASATVIVQLHMGDAVFKYFVGPGRTHSVSAEGAEYRIALSSFLSDDPNAVFDVTKIDRFELLVQDWTLPMAHYDLYLDDVAIGDAGDL